VDNAEACIATAELTGMAPIVRPVGNRPEIIAPFLDRGAWGVQVPHVNTAAEARAAVDAAKYGPEGHRGIFSGGRAAGYGFKSTTADYAKDANRQTLVCLMLEEVEAIDNLPELVTVPGVDVYFIGSGDLSQSMGYTGQPAHPEVQNLMERGVKTITGAGRIAGCSCPDNLIPKFLGLGVQYFHSTVGRLTLRRWRSSRVKSTMVCSSGSRFVSGRRSRMASTTSPRTPACRAAAACAYQMKAQSISRATEIMTSSWSRCGRLGSSRMYVRSASSRCAISGICRSSE